MVNDGLDKMSRPTETLESNDVFVKVKPSVLLHGQILFMQAALCSCFLVSFSSFQLLMFAFVSTEQGQFPGLARETERTKPA